MRRKRLTKTDVDVLVQLLVLGPFEASDWEPLVDDADEFGTRLWSASYANAARPDDLPRPTYTFAPLTIPVTAVEGLKQCGHFVYVTADENGHWEREGLGDTLETLEDRLIWLLDGHDSAPWGWDERDLAERAARAAPRIVKAPTGEDPPSTNANTEDSDPAEGRR